MPATAATATTCVRTNESERSWQGRCLKAGARMHFKKVPASHDDNNIPDLAIAGLLSASSTPHSSWHCHLLSSRIVRTTNGTKTIYHKRSALRKSDANAVDLKAIKMATVTCHEQCDIATTSQQAFTRAPLPQMALLLSMPAPKTRSS
jgi:hypothetical protein